MGGLCKVRETVWVETDKKKKVIFFQNDITSATMQQGRVSARFALWMVGGEALVRDGDVVVRPSLRGPLHLQRVLITTPVPRFPLVLPSCSSLLFFVPTQAPVRRIVCSLPCGLICGLLLRVASSRATRIATPFSPSTWQGQPETLYSQS